MKFLFIIIILACITISTYLTDSTYSAEEIPGPVKQVKNGIGLNDIECNSNMTLIFKKSDDSPACVKPSTAETLIQRGTHTTEIGNQIFLMQDAEYRIFSWHDVPEDQENHIIRMLWIRADSDPVEIAKKSNEKPDGYAAIFLWKFAKELYSNSNDRCIDPNTNEYTEFRCPWLDNGIISIKERTAEWFGKYKDAGGQLDYLILDDESNFGNWALQTKPGWADAIESDPRFVTLIPKINHTSLDLVMDRPHTNHPAYLQWNAIQRQMLVDARNMAIFEPVRELYPNIKASNYKDYVVDMNLVVPEKNGHRQHYLSNFGTHNAKPFYGDLGQYGNKIGQESSTVLKWQMEAFDAVKQSSDVPNMAWIPYFSYAKNDLNKADYEKMVLYLICQTEEPLLFWNPKASDSDNKLVYDLILKVNDENTCG